MTRRLKATVGRSVVAVVVAVAVVALFLADAEAMPEKVLHIGGIFPMEGSWAGGRGCRPAVDLALDDINQRSDILPGYRIEMTADDSKCMPGLGMNVLYELLYKSPPKLMLLGPGCSAVSTFVGEAAQVYNLIVLSYGSSSPALSNRERFPTFFRTHPSGTLHNPTRVKVLEKFEWRRIGTIQQTEEVFETTIEDLEERIRAAGIDVDVRTSFHNDPTNAVRNLRRQDARVIVGLFYENKARRVFCEVYRQGMYGKKYVWLIIGWYSDNWYKKQDDEVNCTAEQLKTALEGHITTEGLMQSPEAVKSISGLTSSKFMQKLEEIIEKAAAEQQSDESTDVKNPKTVVGFVEAPLAYDAVWALALALNQTQRRLLAQNRSLEDFRYEDRDVTKELFNAMNATDFIGVSGRVRFDSEGGRIARTAIEQMTDGNYTNLGYYDIVSKEFTWFAEKERWPGGSPPRDRTMVIKKLRTINQLLLVVMNLLAVVGVSASLLLLRFNWKHRKRRCIRMSQPLMNNMMLLGSAVCQSCIFLEGLDGAHVSPSGLVLVCQLHQWLLCFGFTLAYGSMFTKVWTTYRLTTRQGRDLPKQNRSQLEMWLVIGVLFALDLVLLAVWQSVDPLGYRLEEFAQEESGDVGKDINFLPQLEHCASRHHNTWLGIIFGYKGVLLLFGLLLAYEIRSIKFTEINDSRLVAMSIYNVVVLCLITAPVSCIIGSHQDANFAFVSIAILLSCSLSMGLVFLPKVLEVVRNVGGPEGAALAEGDGEDEKRFRQLEKENAQLKQLLIQHDDRIVQLKTRILTRNRKSPVPEDESAMESRTDCTDGGLALADPRSSRFVDRPDCGVTCRLIPPDSPDSTCAHIGSDHT